MKNRIIGSIVLLAVLMSSAARAIPPSEAIVNISLGTVFTGTGSGWACAVANLPANLDQAASFNHSGEVTFTSTAQTTATSGNGSQDTRSVGITIDDSISGGIFGTKLGLQLKASNTITSTTKWSSTNTNTTGQTATLSITGPQSTDNYTGATAIQIWRDNVYGSYVFFAVE